MLDCYLSALCIDLDSCVLVKDHLTADSRIAVGCVIIDQTAGHPEALCTTVIVYTTADSSCVAGDLTAIERKDTVIEHTTTVAGCLTTRDLAFTHDSQRTVVNDHATLCYCIAQVTVDGKAVQFEYDGLACRDSQCGVGVLCNHVLTKLDNSALVHRILQCCPARYRTFFLLHLDAGVLTIHLRDLTVSVHRHVQGLGTHTRLCRQVNYQGIRVSAVTVVCLADLRKGLKRQIERVRATHEGCVERVRLRTLLVADNTRVHTITGPYIVAKSVVQLLKDPLLGWRQARIFCFGIGKRAVVSDHRFLRVS